MAFEEYKSEFENNLREFVKTLREEVTAEDGQWTIKGFIDIYKNVYTITADTKIVSKILEIHLFPKLLAFAELYGYKLVLTDHQNHYPDVSFVKKENESIRFAVDFKTTYRNPLRKHLCNGFTLGSHGKYFTDRTSTKNIKFPYGSYAGHFCLGIIYNRSKGLILDEAEDIEHLEETKIYDIDALQSITSVINDFEFFVVEKWKIASDKSGSGNTANIGSIVNIKHILEGKGMFSRLGESWFDDYWMNYGKITISDEKTGNTKKITTLKEFIEYRQGDISLIVMKNNCEDE